MDCQQPDMRQGGPRVSEEHMSRIETQPGLGIEETAVGAVLGSEERAGLYTADRLWRTREREYRLCVSLLGLGIGIERIAAALGVHAKTVMAVRDREPGGVQRTREELLTRAGHAANVCLEQMLDEMLLDDGKDHSEDKPLSLKDKAILWGILVDKMRDLAGDPNVRVRVEKVEGPTHADYLRLLEAARGKVVEAECVEIEQLEGGKA